MTRKPPTCGAAIPRRAFPALPPAAPRKAPVRRPGARPATAARAKAPEAVPVRPRAPLGLPAPAAAPPRSALPPFPGARARGPLAHLVGTPRAVAPRTVDLYPPGPVGMALRAATPRSKPAKAPRPSTKRDPILRPMAVPLREGAPRIVKLLKIIDTRQTEIVEGRYGVERSVPIPGSGTENECYRCGALHEVHAYVELEDGSQVVVGTGCARQEALDAGDQALARVISSADRRAKAIVALRAEIERMEPTVKAVEDAIQAAYMAASKPPPVVVEDVSDDGKAARYKLTCGDVVREGVYYRNRLDPPHFLSRHKEGDARAARWDWEMRRQDEIRAMERGIRSEQHQLAEARLKLKKLLAKGG